MFNPFSITYTYCAYGSSETSAAAEGCAIWTIIGITIKAGCFLAWFVFEPSKKIIKLSELYYEIWENENSVLEAKCWVFV